MSGQNTHDIYDGAVDETERAWAAGFFDGEGSTFPVGRRLTVSVGQSGSELPEVLVRFQAAVLGLGNLQGPYDREGHLPIWYWRTQHFGVAQTTIAVLWPYLGPVKRAQATTAIKNAVSVERLPTGRPRGTNRWATQTHCIHGHEFTDANTRWVQLRGLPYRRCRECEREASRRYALQKREMR